MVTCRSMNHQRPTRQRARRPDAHGVGVLPPPKVSVGGKGTKGVGGKPNHCSAVHTLIEVQAKHRTKVFYRFHGFSRRKY